MRECHRTVGLPRSATSRSCRTQQANDGALDNHDNDTTKNADHLPPLPANKALAQAVSQVQIPMDRWAPLHIFKLFIVLVEPPLGLDLSAMEDLRDYLSQLVVMIGGFVDNGIRDIALHSWWLLLGNCSTSTSYWFNFHIFAALC